jgi:hypothetical protein
VFPVQIAHFNCNFCLLKFVHRLRLIQRHHDSFGRSRAVRHLSSVRHFRFVLDPIRSEFVRRSKTHQIQCLSITSSVRTHSDLSTFHSNIYIACLSPFACLFAQLAVCNHSIRSLATTFHRSLFFNHRSILILIRF